MSAKIQGIGKPPKRNTAKIAAMKKANDERKQQYFFSGKAAKESDNTMNNKDQKPAENLPAVITTGFQLAATGSASLQLSSELAAELDASDFEGYEAPRDTLPIASIRQKEVKDDRGKITTPAGGFRMHDTIAKAAGTDIADIDGEAGLLVTILADQTSRTLWTEGNFEKPDCRSFDGITGQGTPGGSCAICPMRQWHGTERPACTENRNLLVYDHTIQASYVLRLGRSGLKPYDLFKSLVKRGGAATHTPVHALKVHVTTKYETVPAPHFVPVFEIGDQVDLATFKVIKAIRSELGLRQLAKTAEIMTVDDERNGNGHAGFQTSDSGGAVPDDVTPISGQADRDDLPF